MSKRTFLLTSSAGIDHYMIEDENGIAFAATGETDPIIERNKVLRNNTDGFTQDRSMCHAASIPQIIVNKWLIEEGLDIYNPDHEDRLAKKLNDPDWAYLRTGGGNLGVSNGQMR